MPTEDQLGPLIEQAGYRLVAGRGELAIWQPGAWGGKNGDTFTPATDARGQVLPPLSQAQIANSLWPTSSPYLKIPVSSQDPSAQTDGAGVAYAFRNGQAYRVGDPTFAPYMPVPVPVNPHPGSTFSSSTSQSFQDPRALALEAERIQNERQNAQAMRDQAALNGDRTAAQYWQTRLDTLGENAAQRQFTSGENVANRQATAQNQREQNVFTGGENAADRAFRGGESALSRAQQAGEFAATYAIQKANAERQQLADRMQAAETYSRLSGSPDLTGYSRFQQAGGGVLGNSLAAGATSLTEQGQLGSARALEATRAPMQAFPDYVNQYAGMSTTNPYLINPYGGVGASTPARPAPPPPPPPVARQYVDAAPAVYPGAGGGAAAAANAAAVAQGANPAGQYAAGWTPGPAWSPSPGFAHGTGYPPIVREPVTAMPTGAGIDSLTARYALGTLGRKRQLGAVSVDPNAGGYPPGYAHGTFTAGDSTDPNDPAAGGAHPEQVSLIDPPGPDNAAASVTPLTPPGVGDTGGGDDDGSIGALLIAIGKFLNAQEARGEPGMPTPLGAMGAAPRFALGSGIMPSDQPYIDEVMATRRATPYSINPYAADYMQQSTTARAIGAAGFQTATGVPGSEVAFEADKYRPGGLARSSAYHRELDLGI